MLRLALTGNRRRLAAEMLEARAGRLAADASVVRVGGAEPRAAPPLPACGLAVLFLPKGNEAIERALSRVAHLVEPGGRVLVVGAKKSGIVSSRRLAERRVGPLSGGLYDSDPANMVVGLSLAHVLREFGVQRSFLLPLLRRGGSIQAPRACSFVATQSRKKAAQPAFFALAAIP